MHRILLILIVVIGVMVEGYSQQRGGGGQVEALKIAYITKALNLSSTEAQKFWPIYNKYNKEVHEVRKEQRRTNAPVLETEEKVLAIRKKYNNEFTKAISQEKTDAFFRSEKEFASVVLKTLNERRNKLDD